MSDSEKEFLKDVAQHEMIVLRDDGLYRHLRFKRPDTGCMHFDIVTYPGYLVYSGDMGCYVFSRLEDMFQFFRTDREYMHLRDGQTLTINPGYWSEKLQAVDGSRHHASATEFDEESFTRAVMGDLVSWIRDHRDSTSREGRRSLWDAVCSEVIGAENDGDGYRKQAAAHDFHHQIGRLHFSFQDFGEHNVRRYTQRFLWCCRAIAWGIQKYDLATEPVSRRKAAP